MVGEGKKDFNLCSAGFEKAQGPVCQLRGVLQAAERMPFFKVFGGRQTILLDLSDSPFKLQKISPDGIGIYHAGNVRF